MSADKMSERNALPQVDRAAADILERYQEMRRCSSSASWDEHENNENNDDNNNETTSLATTSLHMLYELIASGISLLTIGWIYHALPVVATVLALPMQWVAEQTVFLQHLRFFIASNQTYSANSWPPPALLMLALLTVVALIIVHPVEGLTWGMLRSLRSHFVVVLQESCTLWSLLIHNFGTIVATVVAALVFCGLFLVIYILHKTLSPHRNSNKSSYDNNNQKQQQKRKKRNKASMQHGGQKTNNRLQPRIHTTSHNDDDDDGGSKEFDEQQQQQQQAPSVSMADATTAIETETAPLKSGIPSSQEAIHSTATKEQVVPSSNDFDPISMSAAVSDSSHSSTFTHCQEGMAGGDDDTAVTSNLTTLPPPPGLSAVSKANGRKSNRRTRKTAIKEDDGSSNSQHVKAPHFPSGGSKRWNILSSAANETLQTGTTIPAAPCFSSSAPGTAALEYNLFNHSAQQLIPPTGGSSFYSAQTPPGFSQYTAGQTVSDPMDLPGISLQYARPPYHSSLDPIQSPTKTSSDLQSIFPIACPSSNNIFQTPGRNHFHDNVSATTSVSSPFGTPISSESISLFSESLGDATAAATTCSTTASPWGNGGTLITPTTTPRRNIPPPPGMAMQQQLRPDNHLLLPSFGPSQSKPRWDEYGYYCGGERVSGSGTATTTTTTTTSTASNLAVGTSFSPSPQRRQHQQQLPASPMVRDNPFQNDEEDQIVAELQELGGQMVGSVLDF